MKFAVLKGDGGGETAVNYMFQRDWPALAVLLLAVPLKSKLHRHCYG